VKKTWTQPGRAFIKGAPQMTNLSLDVTVRSSLGPHDDF
jgi:hypothetical protein